MTGPFGAAFAGRRVLVTGHTGFKGSWLATWLHRLGAQVVGLALPPSTEPSAFEAMGVEELLAGHHLVDVRDAAAVEEVVATTRADVVFHLAAQPLVREGHARPVATFGTNVMGTVHVLDAVRTAGRPCAVVVVTSDKCYENVGQVWGYREADPMGGADPYSASKGATELVAASYRRSYFPPDGGVLLASARAGNVVGGGDWSADRLVPDAVRAVAAGETLVVRNPGSTRPWQHVTEPLSGYLALAARLLAGDTGCCKGWNFGPEPGTEVPVARLVEGFLAEWGSGDWEHVPVTDVHEAHHLRLAIEQARTELGWHPRWDVDEMVRRTARWYRLHAEGEASMREVTLADIAAYEAAMGEQR